MVSFYRSPTQQKMKKIFAVFIYYLMGTFKSSTKTGVPNFGFVHFIEFHLLNSATIKQIADRDLGTLRCIPLVPGVEIQV